MRKRAIVVTLLQLCLFLALELVGGQLDARAAHVITIIVPAGVGSSTDYASRLFAREMERQLGQNIVVINIAGARGYDRAATARPDGETLVVCTKMFRQFAAQRLVDINQFAPVAGFAGGYGLLAPRNTARAVVDRLERATQRVTATASFRESLRRLNLVVDFVPSSQLPQRLNTW